jgi:hypothetical protein
MDFPSKGTWTARVLWTDGEGSIPINEAFTGLNLRIALLLSPALSAAHKMTHFLPSCFFAAATTWSGSNPNFLCNSLSGAEAPNVFIPTT